MADILKLIIGFATGEMATRHPIHDTNKDYQSEGEELAEIKSINFSLSDKKSLLNSYNTLFEHFSKLKLIAYKENWKNSRF